MANTVYANVDSHMVATDGGHVQVIVDADATAQGNSGTVLPCRVAHISALCAERVHWSINTSTLVSTGGIVPSSSEASLGISPMEVPIDDISKLWFFADAVASVLITYRT